MSLPHFVTAPRPAMSLPHFVPDNEHLDLRGISNSITAAPNQAAASSSQKIILEDGLKVMISCHTYYLFISMLIGIAVAGKRRPEKMD
jgi:hypothetical protein